ncbi:protein of unknown function [Taphrina deformans PYCC 5710]|uniref:Uncharacterized protein n=1 Tax=Taphrina deformans (strain PYCC 5710 / ATCC 11124 / CBS 356.35 / IMI 108563 / JCM 9778 / NBRC 8474) TaxID=1097556 RepID=R4XGR9_TAPDE|nr:protein of unknown function [Taphrina deformans PYCC 5710]|eukprot:CCG84991.1 protein of unknown function [Taphrina deformans PYCC 5710]
MILVGILYSAKTLFDGMDGLANACINGDWTSTKSSIAAGTACVTNAFRIVMGAVMAQKTYVGQITNPFTQTKRGILDAIDLEAFTSQIDQSTWMGSFDLATFAHPVVMVLTDTITQDAHVVQYWFDEHTHQHTVSHKLDSSGEGSPSLHKRAGALNVFFSWTEADSNEEALANDDQDLSSIASMMFDDLNNNQQSAEACFSVCDNTAEVVTGYLGAYEEN